MPLQRSRVNSNKMKFFMAALTSVLTACSGLPKYVNATSKESATIEIWSQLIRCNIMMREGNICSAQVIVIDGKKVGTLASVRASPGIHKIMLSCTTSGARARSYGHSFIVDLAPRSKYQIQPRWEQEVCVVDIIDTATKQAIPTEKIPREEVVGTGA